MCEVIRLIQKSERERARLIRLSAGHDRPVPRFCGPPRSLKRPEVTSIAGDLVFHRRSATASERLDSDSRRIRKHVPTPSACIARV